MDNKLPDRRIRRTRQLLGDALIELIREKGFEALNVQDIVDRANVARSTFYSHYHDKEDLLIGQFDRLIDELAEHAMEREATGRMLYPTLLLFQHVQQQHELYRAMLWGRGVDLLFKRGQQTLSARIGERIAVLQTANRAIGPDIPVAVIAHYFSGALLALLRWWLDQRMTYTPEQMDAMFQALALPGIWAALGWVA